MAQMLKADQVQFLAYNAGICKSEADKAMKTMGDMIRTALSGTDGKPMLGAKVKIEGIGTFTVKKTPAKSGKNPQVIAAEKALEEGKATEVQTQLLQAVKNGTVKATYEKPEGLAIKFKAEAALALWCGGEDEDDDSAPTDGAPLSQEQIDANVQAALADPNMAVQG